MRLLKDQQQNVKKRRVESGYASFLRMALKKALFGAFFVLFLLALDGMIATIISSGHLIVGRSW